ncbi:MAG TPA: DNA-binding domain-containing protein, partial [Paraburkholderia sp.]|nr:DNA-binding domain-containing protein [Paraburkholderia sp.]
MASQLESLQRLLADALGKVECEAASIDVFKTAPPAPTYDPARRIELYRGNLRANWRAALANAYPVLLALVGDAWFDALSLAYARTHPSQSGDLNRFGAALPEFIGTYESDARYRY